MRLNRRAIRDDRGQRATVQAYGVGSAVSLRGDRRRVAKHYDRFARAKKAAHPLSLLLMVFAFGVNAVLMAATAEHALGRGAIDESVSATLTIAAGVTALVGLAWPIGATVRKRRLDRRRAVLPRLCAQCHYDLFDVPVADDGCTVCPECGAAWRFTPHA